MLRKVFDSFDRDKSGSIPTSMVRTIFSAMGHRVDETTLAEIIAEVDADGELLFPIIIRFILANIRTIYRLRFS